MKIDDRLNATILEHSLPETDNYFKPHGTMETYVATFFNLLQRMEGFYEQMDTMDELTCVVDPMQPTTKHDYRIIRLGTIIFQYLFLQEIFRIWIAYIPVAFLFSIFFKFYRSCCLSEISSESTWCIIGHNHIFWTNKTCWKISHDVQRQGSRLELRWKYPLEFFENIR